MRLSRFFRGALLSTVMATAGVAHAVNADPATFAETAWQQSASLTQATGMAWATDGTNRLFVTRKGGQLMVIKDGALLATPWATLTPYTSSECGLLSVAFHPSFTENHFVYLFVTVSSTEQQIQRWIDNPATDTGTFDKVIVGGLPTQGINHDGGGLGFGRDGHLYWSIGDNGSPRRGIDGDLTVLAAKVGRATAEGAIPLDNPFYDGPGPNNDYIWARGFRNPFTLTFRPATGDLWLDVVGSLWEQVMVVTRAMHGGWDDYENDQPAGYQLPAIAYRTNGQNQRAIVNLVRASDVVTVTTTTPHQYRRGAEILIAATSDNSFMGRFFVASIPTPTTFTFAQVAADASSNGGTATQTTMGGAIGGGTFYASTLFPPDYWGNFFFGDYNSGQYFRVTLDGQGVASVKEWADYGVALDTTVGPDGALYASDFAFSGNGTIYRTVPVALPTDPIVMPTDLWLTEGGRAAFTVVLPQKPMGQVGLAVLRTSGDADLSVIEGATLTFTAANWDIPQRVVILSTADADRVDDTATFTISGTNLADRTVNVYVPDAPPAIYAYPSPLTIAEGASAALSIGLTEAATSPVTIDVTITGDADVTAATTITFDPSDGTSPKLLQVSAASDVDTTNDSATITLTAAGYTARAVPVTVLDTTVVPDLAPPADLTTTPDLTSAPTEPDLAEESADLAAADLMMSPPEDDLGHVDDVDQRAPASADLPPAADLRRDYDFAKEPPDLLARADLFGQGVTFEGGGYGCQAGGGGAETGAVVLTVLAGLLIRRRSPRPRRPA